MGTPTNIVRALGLLALTAGCGSAGGAGSERAAEPGPAVSATVLVEAARADSVRRHYTAADVGFMRDMIHHHAQALEMARMAPARGASPELRTLAARIINGQRDEIALMQRWLRDRGEAVPEVALDGRAAGLDHGDHGAPAHAPDASMAGMLSRDQMARLAAASGAEWDQLFLAYMIQHHQGAVTMVEALFDQPGAAQGADAFRIASNIIADQRTEIDRMQRMLRELAVEAP